MFFVELMRPQILHYQVAYQMFDLGENHETAQVVKQDLYMLAPAKHRGGGPMGEHLSWRMLVEHR